MRSLVALALVLLSSSAHAALLNTPTPGYVRLRLTPAHIDWHADEPDGSISIAEFIPAYVDPSDATSKSVWFNAPSVATWRIGNDTVPFVHDFTPELALGILDLTLVTGAYNDTVPLTRAFTYSAAGGYSRTANVPVLVAPEPSSLALFSVVGALLMFVRRRLH